MIRKLMAVGASIGVLLTASLAHAQARDRLGQQGQFIVSADRLFSLFSYVHVAQDNLANNGGVKTVDTVNQSAISLLWGDSSVGGNPFGVPRVGFDYVLLPNVTVGGNVIVFFTVGGNRASDTTQNGVTMSRSQDNPSVFTFGVAPRGGYILQLTDLFSIWLRGGFSYYVQTAKTTTGTGNTQVTDSFSQNQFALDIDPQFVLTPVSHVGFTAGPTLDIPLAGGHSLDHTAGGTSTSTSAWSSILYFGVTVGMLVHF
jgi:hypothetical protein